MTTTEHPQLPPIVCTPWCEYGDGHPEAAFRDDQTCWGRSEYLDLSLEEVIRDQYVGICVPRIGVMAYRHRPTEAPSVYVHLDNVETHRGGDILDLPVHLTAGEALSLAAALVKAATEVQGAQR